MRTKLVAIFIILIYQVQALVVEIDVRGEINHGTVELVNQGFDLAEGRDAKAVLIVLDTPGGLLSSTKDIVSRIMNSKIPVVTYVPKGAFSASAGTIILLSGHVSAMANGTSLGSATPVGFSSEEERNKTINYIASYVESIAEERGRPKDVVRRFVTEGISLTSREAYEMGVIDFLADSKDELFERLDGFVVNVGGKNLTLKLKGEEVFLVKKSLKSEVLSLLTNPIVSFLLLLIGIYALIIGFSTPGIGLEVVGLICIVLSLLGLNVLSVDYLGLVLILIGVSLLIAELLNPTHGVLAVASIICIFLGSLMLIREPLMPKEFYESFLYVVIGVGLGFASFMTFAIIKVAQARRLKARVGRLEGEVGEVMEFKEGFGYVKVRGEIWRFVCDEELKVGDRVKVIGREGLTLRVKKL